ncbi:hypothetical protein [Isoalcanivorax pacificus]|uniref:hypothetical protein n=1 Tax=Isoalcanivorax pacificus TaxID=1306787 RepID=UPI00118681F5|nr:hypothetical protein [Isoalcanivorax pacificus]
MLTQISYDGDDWVYSYASGDFGDAGRTRYLSQVTDPEGLSWTYDYWPYNGAGTSGAGSLRSVTNPHGGVHEFTYGLQQFNADVLDTTWNIVVNQYQRRNGTVPVSSETYTYAQTASSPVSDTTTVTSDDGVTLYRHFGISGGQSGAVWKIGLLDSVEYTPVSGVPSTERYYWEGQQVSQETYKRNRGTGLYIHFDDRYRIPYLTEKQIERESRTYITQYSDFLAQGWHPAPQLYQTITRTGPSGTREEGVRFFYDLDKWIVGIIRQWNYGQKIAFLYNMDANGNVIEAFEDGRWAYYARTPEGEISSEQIGNNAPFNYSNYEYGKAGDISFPDGGFIEREMDSYGRVISEENANGITSWSYDVIGRLEGIFPAASAPIALSWSANSVEITRQGYENTKHFDGFGRVYQEQISGTGSPSISIARSYDHEDRVTEESVNGSEFGYIYDGYSRLLRIEHDDGDKLFSYGPGSKTVEDEMGNLAIYSYATYSSPDEGELESIQVDDLDEIVIERNSAGEVVRVSQADIQRLYAYYNYNQLASIHDPETGEVVYGYDTAGNISVEFFTPDLGGQSGLNIQYQYDAMNRKTGMYATAYIQEPLDDLQDTIVRNRWSEDYTYDTVGNMLMSERNRNEEIYEYIPSLEGYYLTDIVDHPVTWQMSYDAEGRLLSESLHVDANQFALAYAYSPDGHLSSTTYPSGEVVLHNPNSYGWPLSAGSYATVSGYHVNGMPSTLQFGNGDIYSSSVDGYHRLAGFRVDAGSTVLMNHTLAYNPAGNLISSADLNNPSDTVSLSYDSANQLVSASGFWGAKTIDYDGLGNVLSVNNGASSTLYQYDIDNRLTAVSGAVTRNYSYPDYYFGAVGSNGVHDLKRDINNQLYKYQPAGFYSGWTIMEYDARGRVAKTFTDSGGLEYSMYGANGKLMFQWDGQDDYKEYIYLGQRLVAERAVAQ